MNKRTYTTTTLLLAAVMRLHDWPLVKIEPNPDNHDPKRNQQRFVLEVPEGIKDPETFAMAIRNDAVPVAPFRLMAELRTLKEMMKDVSPVVSQPIDARQEAADARLGINIREI